MLFSLIEKLKKVKDFRRSQGRRYPLHLVLTILIFGIMSENVSYKKLEIVVKNNSESLIRTLNIVEQRLTAKV
jgi:hypothetical protein